MTVKELIEILQSAVDIDIAEVTFHVKDDHERTFELHTVNQFSISPDVTITIKEFSPPLISKSRIRRNKQEMVSETMKKINDDIKNK